MIINLRSDFLGTSGEFYWYTPDWLGKRVCQLLGKHKDTDPEFGNMHCLRCSLCLYQSYYSNSFLLCPECQMTTEQSEKYMNCIDDDCNQECLNG